MHIAKKSMLTGNVSMRYIPVTEEQVMRWERGELIQVAMPELSLDDREFLMTGITPLEWGTAFDG
tara:strand:- start:3028 stop:3222 length:195 start_codon:yes stop_codon:yes gene_type:complete